MPDPVLDPSVPCCRDLSRVRVKLPGCVKGPAPSPGATGGTPPAASGTFVNTLNATGGGAGGGSGASYIVVDPTVSEGWL